MELRICLLGPPRIEWDGVMKGIRGYKAWGLLSYLLLSATPVARERLADLLFAEADDPLGALRWSLSQLRRALGPGSVLEGDPLRVTRPPGAVVDVDVLTRGTWVEAVDLSGLGRQLLEGISFPRSPGFELWLEGERRHLSGATEAVLQEAALECLAHADPRKAADHASMLVSLNPLDENSQTLLVRSLQAAGDHAAATRQVDACTKLLRRELGVEPGPALRAAAVELPVRADGRFSGRSAALAQLEAGEACIAAGARQAGLESLHSAVVAARMSGDGDLLARALVASGSALVHAARGHDVEGAAALHEGMNLAEKLGANRLAARAGRELGYIELLRARYDRADALLARSARLAASDDEELSWVEAVRGACHSDVGEYSAAQTLLLSAIERADRKHTLTSGAFALSFLGRVHVLRREVAQAATALDRSFELASAAAWTAFLPWPESLRAEVDLLLGEVDAAERRFDHAFALGCQLGDPCWESIAARGLGLIAASRGDVEGALELLDEAPRRCRRFPDSYLWIEAYALEALCEVGIGHGAEAAPEWVEELERMASRNGMRELLVRSTLHRAHLGDEGALDAANSLAAHVDNPVLSRLLSDAAD